MRRKTSRVDSAPDSVIRASARRAASNAARRASSPGAGASEFIRGEDSGSVPAGKAVRTPFAKGRLVARAGRVPMKRAVAIAIAVVLVVIAGAVYYVYTSLDSIVKLAIERYGSELTGTAVHVESVKLALREG